MPVKVYKQKGQYKGDKYNFVTKDASGKIRSRHKTATLAKKSARARNAGLRKK